MSIRTRLRDAARTKPDRYKAPSFGPTFGAMAGGGRFDDNGMPIIEFSPEMRTRLLNSTSLGGLGHIYRTQPAVRTCVNFLALNIAHLNLKTYRQDDEEQTPQPKHPLAKLLRRPNPRSTRFDLIRGTVSDLGIYDNCYWLKVFIGNARQLFRIPAWAVTPRGGDWLTGPAYYTVNSGKGSKDFSPAQIVHFHGYSPDDTRIGAPILEALRAVLTEEVEASAHRASFWKNAGQQEGIILRKAAKDVGEWTVPQKERFLTDWANRHSGSDNAGKAGVLEDDMQWQNSSFSPKDSEFIAGREWSLDTTATAYLIPLAMLSRKGTSTFASLSEFHTIMYVDTLGPWNASIEGTIWLQLVPDFGDDDLYVEFNIEEKLQGNFETQLNALRSAVQVPWMSVNEARKLRGLPPIDDPAFDVPMLPANYNSVPEGGANALNAGLPGPAPIPGPDPLILPPSSNGHAQALPDDVMDALERMPG